MNRTLKFLLLLLFLSYGVFAKNTPYVIVISFDGFRWDYLNRGLTPELQHVYENGVRALSLRPAFPSKTFPNHYSLITGDHPENHGIIANNFSDPVSGDWYSMSDTVSTRDDRWYKADPFWTIAEKNGITTASYFWPGSEQNSNMRHPTYYKHYQHKKPYTERVDTLIKWLQLPQAERPRFLTVYFHDTDSYGHEYSPDSPETNLSIQRLDSIAGYIQKEITRINMQDSVNLIFVSDHGMTATPADQVIYVDSLLGSLNCKVYDSGPVVRIHPDSDNDIQKVYEKLKASENHYRVYTKENIPSYYHYSKGDLIPPIIMIADIGWSIVAKTGKKWRSKGNHGYEKDYLDMHGIFVANGPAFKNKYITGTLWNIDLFPLLCEIYNISQPGDIDGSIERIEFILKGR